MTGDTDISAVCPTPWAAVELSALLDYAGPWGAARAQLPALLDRSPGQVEDAVALLLERDLARTWRCPRCGTARVAATARTLNDTDAKEER
jgi:hypothetical protein